MKTSILRLLTAVQGSAAVASLVQSLLPNGHPARTFALAAHYPLSASSQLVFRMTDKEDPDAFLAGVEETLATADKQLAQAITKLEEVKVESLPPRDQLRPWTSEMLLLFTKFHRIDGEITALSRYVSAADNAHLRVLSEAAREAFWDCKAAKDPLEQQDLSAAVELQFAELKTKIESLITKYGTAD